MSTFLTEALPQSLSLAKGATISLADLLARNFGSASASFTGAWITYLGAGELSSNSFSYWNPAQAAPSSWLVSGTDIGSGFENQRYVSSAAFGSAILQAGNDIGPLAFVTLAASMGSHDEYTQYSIGVVPPGLGAAVSASGPTASDVVAAARRFAAAYSGLINNNDCAFIAAAVAGAAGAPLPVDSQSLVPSENQEGGFWRIAYRGSDPGTVADWSMIVKPGDIVRFDWTDPAQPQHTTLVLGRNANGTLSVFDNGGDTIGIHNSAQYSRQSVPSSVTIFRLTTDGLNLIQRTGDNEFIPGTSFNDLIRSGAGDDSAIGGDGNDVVYGNLGSDTLAGNRGQDQLYGGQGDDRLLGGQDADTLYGNLGSDLLFGNLGDDLISGGQGNDTIFGGQGNDTVDGGLGDDVLAGNLGADRFMAGTSFGHDRIADFDLVSGDRIDLRGQTFSITTANDGWTLLTLSGGGTLELTGISAGQVNAGFFVASTSH